MIDEEILKVQSASDGPNAVRSSGQPFGPAIRAFHRALGGRSEARATDAQALRDTQALVTQLHQQLEAERAAALATAAEVRSMGDLGQR